MDKVTVNIATQPHRVHTLETTLQSLLPQCDTAFVYLNNFTEVPKFLKNKKVKYFQGEDLGASGKFYNLENFKGYYFTCDDDILYPKDYIGYMKHMIDLYKRQAAIGVHATVYHRLPIKSYYTSGKIYYCNDGNSENRFVNMLGTGTLGFHTDTFPELTINDFPEKNMCDPYFAKYAIERNVPQVTLTRAGGWIKLQSTNGDDKSIWRSVARNDKKQTEVINSIKGFSLKKCEYVERIKNDGCLDEKAIIEIFKLLDKGTILELGSGEGTKQLSKFYKMYSIEHDPAYLNKHNSTYIKASLKEGFFDLSNIAIPEYDLLIIDAPPAYQGGKRSGFLRYVDKFDLTKPILVDDVHRDEEWNLMVELVSLTNRNAKIIDCKNKKFAII